jgi:hypothetical protein
MIVVWVNQSSVGRMINAPHNNHQQLCALWHQHIRLFLRSCNPTASCCLLPDLFGDRFICFICAFASKQNCIAVPFIHCFGDLETGLFLCVVLKFEVQITMSSILKFSKWRDQGISKVRRRPSCVFFLLNPWEARMVVLMQIVSLLLHEFQGHFA